MHTRVHPGFIHIWKSARPAGGCGVSIGTSQGDDPIDCGSGGGPEPAPGFFAADFGGGSGGFGGEPFGVRRPLRFLAYKLGLNDAQVAQMAIILDDLKTERAQAAVDDRRTLTSFAQAISGETYDEAAAKAAADRRGRGADRLGEAVVKALGRIHALLTSEQRERLAYLIRTGALAL